MSQWYSCQINPPEEGLKVLCHKTGDIYVAMRIGDVYIPYYITERVYLENLIYPTEWMYIDFPDGLEGRWKIQVGGKGYLFTLDELRIMYPEDYNDLVQHFKASLLCSKPKEK